MKHLFFFSNPFGYGPTATMIAVARKLVNLSDLQVHIVARGLCSEIIDHNSNIDILGIDQRNPDEICKLLLQYDNAYVVSSLNRFAIIASKRVGRPCCFIDTLTYLWEEIPDDYLAADVYYTSDFPGVREKVSHTANAMVTPLIIDDMAFNDAKKNKKTNIVVQLGGMKSPLNDDVPKNYLDILAYALRGCKVPILVTGGTDGLSYLKSVVNNPCLKFQSLSKNNFIKALENCKLLITTPGLNSTLEALYRNVPVNFIMPTNLSQWTNHNLFAMCGAAGNDITWEDIIGTNLGIEGLPEYDAIIKLNDIAGTVSGSQARLGRFANLFHQTCVNIPDIQKQTTLLSRYGCDGAQCIAADLIKRWGLEKC